MSMTIDQARLVAAALTRAADKAEAEGGVRVDLMGELQDLDDAARADLQDAIERAAKGQPT